MALTKPGEAAGFPSLNHTNSSTSASISQQTIGYLFLVGNTACMVRWEGQVGTWSDGRGRWGHGQMGGAGGDMVRWEGHMGTWSDGRGRWGHGQMGGAHGDMMHTACTPPFA